jgi:hypothetical protein
MSAQGQRSIHHSRARLGEPYEIRIRERRPRLYKALPLYRNEILEAYYRSSPFSVTFNHRFRRRFFLRWIYQAGKPLRDHVRHLVVYCQFESIRPRFAAELSLQWTPKTGLEATLSAGSWELSGRHSQQRCHCPVCDLVARRLQCRDALNDPLCVARVIASNKMDQSFGSLYSSLGLSGSGKRAGESGNGMKGGSWSSWW